jgi:hypothetical protein
LIEERRTSAEIKQQIKKKGEPPQIALFLDE